eukprot:TRINITY_DN4382_c0_g1_i1.p1 TRINITY_DN4382_c0_g1~~TRINITY_DN4382_c0_g1_i1.p1  ORF type:complete len:758 (-),score=208.85 TRINITY_DN4382_c0_g1_i1:466-2739(-)
MKQLPKLEQNFVQSCFISQFATKKDHALLKDITVKEEKARKSEGGNTEMVLGRKLELAERLKTMEKTYEEVEGVRPLCRCIMTSTRSLEESVADPDSQCFVLKLLISLSNNLGNFLGLTKVNMQKLNEKIDKANSEIDSWKFVSELEKKVWEEEQKREREKSDSKPLFNKYNELKEKHHQYIIDMERTKKELEGKILLLTLTNGKLLERIKRVEEDADVIRTTEIIQGLNMDLHQVSEMLMNEKEQGANVGFKFTTLLAAARGELKEKNSTIERKTSEYEALLEKYNKTVQELHEAREHAKQTLETAQMANEERLHAMLKIKDLEEEIGEREAEIQELSTKNFDLELQLKLQKEGLIQNKEVELAGELFAFVWGDSLAEKNNQNKYSAREENAQPREKEELKRSGTFEVNIDAINPEKYSYLKPSYRSLVDSLIPLNESKKALFAPPFPVWLHVTMRAILDSKMNEILLSYYTNKQLIRFPHFVYSWLGTFHVDKTTHSVKRLEYTEKEGVARRSRCDLLLGLEAASVAKLWEVKVFKDFLLEQLTSDELAYFLHCRFVLFRGPQLAVPTASFCVIPFVSKQAVSDAVDHVMHAYSSDKREALKAKLAYHNVKTYGNSEALDSNMVLRVMLEFYRKEKKENFARFERLYTETSMNLKSHSPLFPFEDFNDLLANKYDKNISDLEICEIYKEAFIGGGSAINSDSILLAFNETSFWVNYLRLKGLSPELKYDDRGDIDKSTERGKQCATIHAYPLSTP